jgi:hypothetical protein
MKKPIRRLTSTTISAPIHIWARMYKTPPKDEAKVINSGFVKGLRLMTLSIRNPNNKGAIKDIDT